MCRTSTLFGSMDAVSWTAPFCTQVLAARKLLYALTSSKDDKASGHLSLELLFMQDGKHGSHLLGTNLFVREAISHLPES